MLFSSCLYLALSICTDGSLKLKSPSFLFSALFSFSVLLPMLHGDCSCFSLVIMAPEENIPCFSLLCFTDGLLSRPYSLDLSGNDSTCGGHQAIKVPIIDSHHSHDLFQSFTCGMRVRLTFSGTVRLVVRSNKLLKIGITNHII